MFSFAFLAGGLRLAPRAHALLLFLFSPCRLGRPGGHDRLRLLGCHGVWRVCWDATCFSTGGGAPGFSCEKKAARSLKTSSPSSSYLCAPWPRRPGLPPRRPAGAGCRLGRRRPAWCVLVCGGGFGRRESGARVEKARPLFLLLSLSLSSSLPPLSSLLLSPSSLSLSSLSLSLSLLAPPCQ